MPASHRNDDPRVCGAVTVVTQQTTVFVNGKLWAVDGDPDSDGAGGLIPTGTSVYIEGKLVIVNTPDQANPDNLCPAPPHCDPATAGGSSDTFAY